MILDGGLQSGSYSLGEAAFTALASAYGYVGENGDACVESFGMGTSFIHNCIYIYINTWRCLCCSHASLTTIRRANGQLGVLDLEEILFVLVPLPPQRAFEAESR